MMPFSKDKGQREDARYCSLCFNHGELQYKGNNLKEFQDIVYQQMIKDGSHPWFAKFAVWTIQFAPRWKK